MPSITDYKPLTASSGPFAIILRPSQPNAWIIIGRVMGLLMGSIVVLFLFFARDVFLLGSILDHVWRRLSLYCGMILSCLLVAVWIWHSLRPGSAGQLVRSQVLWVSVLITHAVLCFVARWFKRRPEFADRMWIMAVTPAPMLIFALLAFSQALTTLFGDANGLGIGVALSGGWIAAVLIGVLVFRKAQRDWEDFDFAATLAEIASWTGIGILPFTGVLELAEAFRKYD